MRTGEGEKGSATFGDVSEGPAAPARAEMRRDRDPARGESPAAGSVTTVRTHRDHARFRARARSWRERGRPPPSDCVAAVRAAPKSLAIHRTFSSAQGCRRCERATEACMDEGGRGTVDGIRPPAEPYLAGPDGVVARPRVRGSSRRAGCEFVSGAPARSRAGTMREHGGNVGRTAPASSRAHGTSRQARTVRGFSRASAYGSLRAR